MLQVITALALIALGMGLDAFYQRRIRIAECNAYDTGYQQGKKEGKIKDETRETRETRFPFSALSGECIEIPSMDAPVKMPETFEERLKKHGRATVMMKGGETA